MISIFIFPVTSLLPHCINHLATITLHLINEQDLIQKSLQTRWLNTLLCLTLFLFYRCVANTHECSVVDEIFFFLAKIVENRYNLYKLFKFISVWWSIVHPVVIGKRDKIAIFVCRKGQTPLSYEPSLTCISKVGRCSQGSLCQSWDRRH